MVGTHRYWMRGKSGGIGFVLKSEMECQNISCNSKDVCFIKIGSHAKGYDWPLYSIYLSCEGIRGEENVLNMKCVNDVVSKAKEDGRKIIMGGDMNAHIWVLDKCENKNGKPLKRVMDEMSIQILNCVWESVKSATWFSEKSEFTLEYIGVDEWALKCVESAYILERGEVVESDHAALGVKVEWKVKRTMKCGRNRKSKQKIRLTARNWDVLEVKWKRENTKIYQV